MLLLRAIPPVPSTIDYDLADQVVPLLYTMCIHNKHIIQADDGALVAVAFGMRPGL